MGSEQSRARINAYNFIMKHLQEGLADGQWKWDEDVTTRGTRSLYAGMGMAVVVVIAVALVAFISPRHGVASSEIVLSRDSGQMYVQMEGRLHPVSGLAAARLVLGRAAEPSIVTDKDILGLPQGTPVGMLGGPRALPEDAGHTPEKGMTWAMCDYAEPTTDRFYKVRATMLWAAVDDEQVLASPEISLLAVHDDEVWYLTQGHRRKVAGMSRAQALARGARVVSASLLSSLVEMPEMGQSSWPMDSGDSSICAVWHVSSGRAQPQLSLRAVNIEEQWRSATGLLQQDGPGDAVDAFLLTGRRAIAGHAAPLVGGGSHDSLVATEHTADEQVDVWIIGDDGLRYGTQRQTLPVLGIDPETLPLPWPMVVQLNSGPYLHQAQETNPGQSAGGSTPLRL